MPSLAERGRLLEWAAATGFEGIELSPRWFDFRNLSFPELKAFSEEVTDAGLCISGININRCIFTRTPKASLHFAEVEPAIEVVEILRVEIVNISLSMPTLPGSERAPMRGCEAPDSEHERAAELVAHLGNRAAKGGVTIAIDIHDDGLLDTPELCVRLLERVGLSNVGINPDIRNLCREPGQLPNWRAVLVRLAPHAKNWHVKNYRNAQPAPLWDGDIDYTIAFDMNVPRGLGPNAGRRPATQGLRVERSGDQLARRSLVGVECSGSDQSQKSSGVLVLRP
ncbi:MAG: sugar phosphate isomerase/epimerase [Acidobacteria bacterium]|nr:sugar phosphate isomerase/epimerase [Acidobacteriota bacterium]